MPDEALETYLKSMSEEDKLLVILRDELYGGSWDRFLKDLDDRLKGKPYIFKLVNRIEQDIERIQRLQAFEAEQEVDLAQFMPET